MTFMNFLASLFGGFANSPIRVSNINVPIAKERKRNGALSINPYLSKTNTYFTNVVSVLTPVLRRYIIHFWGLVLTSLPFVDGSSMFS